MELQLTRPLAVFDIESTGVNAEHDRIVEIAVLKIFPDGTSRSNVRRINPEMPIPPSATAVHGISDADVAACPPFSEIAPKLAEFIFQHGNVKIDQIIPCQITVFQIFRQLGGDLRKRRTRCHICI